MNMNMLFQAEEIVWAKVMGVQGMSGKNKSLVRTGCRVGLENIGGEIGNMVCGPDPEELCKPHQEIWILCYWEWGTAKDFKWQQCDQGKKMRGWGYSQEVIAVIHERWFKTWNRGNAYPTANLLNLRFPKCFHHELFSPYVTKKIFRTQFGECWHNISFFKMFLFHFFTSFRISDCSFFITQWEITTMDKGTCKLSDEDQFSRSINE